ncbi:MAG: flagellar export chaperone FlgN [Lachnospiraceae bacterium]|nr:flagellar export chaperone FlgN [Lachnospiraceae bacterium]
MDHNYLDLLEESLIKKNRVLDEIKALCDKQGALVSDNMDLSELDPFIEKKGELIEELDKLDEGFETVYDRVSEELKDNKEKYSEQIKRMQNLIREITEKSTAISAQEERNKNLMKVFFGKKRNEVKEGRVNSKAALNYYKVQSNSGFVDAQFMDDKK